MTGVLFASSSFAQSVEFTAVEIAKILSGNSAHGYWNGQRYKQYFNTDGTTIYAPQYGRSSFGKWRVNADKNTFESLWNEGKWATFNVVRQDEELYWQELSGKKQKFTIVPGQRLLWKQ
jgi:hypothetical protein